MARHPADGSEHDDVITIPSGLLTEVAALRHRLAALEAHLAGHASEQPAGHQATRQTSLKKVAWITTCSVLAMIAGASIVYGQSGVNALFVSKEGNVAIGPSGLGPVVN